jgi:peroxiredoxin
MGGTTMSENYNGFKIMKRIAMMMILTLTLVLAGCSGGIDKGNPAPDFTLTDLQGNNVTLSQYKGKNIYLNFWASWCGPCKDELPDIEKIHQEYKDKDLVVLTVNPGEEKEIVKKFIEDQKYTFPVLLDSKMDVARLYKTNDIPVSLFINKEGTIVFKKVGLMTGEEMKKAVDSLYQ